MSEILQSAQFDLPTHQGQPINLNVRMWGYLQATSPQLKPALVSSSQAKNGWKAVCSGGCGFALLISDRGTLEVWGSTADGQFHQTMGKHQDCLEHISLLTESSFSYAAAGWAHCVAVTDIGEVYSWGWKDCVPKGMLTEQGCNAASSNIGTFTSNVLEAKGLSEEGLMLPRSADRRCSVVSGSSVSSESSQKIINSPADSKRMNLYSASRPKILHEKVTSPMATRTQLHGDFQEIATGRDDTDNDSSSDETFKKRKLNIHKTSSAETIMGADDNVVATPCLVLFPQMVKITKVTAGGRHTLALSGIGHVWGWGYGGEGQLGLGLRVHSISSPTLIPCLESTSYLSKDKDQDFEELSSGYSQKIPGNCIIDIACGGRHSVVLTDGGALLTFGWGLHGQCGQGSTDDELSPYYVSSLGGLQVTGIAAGLWHTLCITSIGDVYAFGSNQFGQLGVGGDQAEMFPRLIELLALEEHNAVCVSAGARHSAICTEEGVIFCWGWNKYGQVQFLCLLKFCNALLRAKAIKFRSMSVDRLLVSSDQQLGLGDNLNRDKPCQVPLVERSRSVACGWWHTLALVYAQ